MIARPDALQALASDHFDIVVIGGGITGAGVALDAASRGYSVALVEKADYASGTSSRSSKLVHGGLRYLQNFDLGLVREALLERQLMVQLAPHLVHPLPLVVAAFDNQRPDRAIGAGLHLYDVMSVDKLRSRRPRRLRRQEAEPAEWSPDRHRTIDGDEVVKLVPALEGREPTAGYLFYDCQTDDSRLVLTVLGEAERFGTVMANGCEVTELIQENGRARGVKVTDVLSGGEFAVRADNVINATGVWGRSPAARGAARRGRGAGHPPQPRHPHHLPPRGRPARRGCDRPRRRRAQHLRPAVARPHADRHHRQRLRRRGPRPHPALRAPTSTTCSKRPTRSSAPT
jgi:glycerol-3-phosphate dehydrogenase